MKNESHSMNWYRISTLRRFAAGKRLEPRISADLKRVSDKFYISCINVQNITN